VTTEARKRCPGTRLKSQINPDSTPDSCIWGEKRRGVKSALSAHRQRKKPIWRRARWAFKSCAREDSNPRPSERESDHYRFDGSGREAGIRRYPNCGVHRLVDTPPSTAKLTENVESGVNREMSRVHPIMHPAQVQIPVSTRIPNTYGDSMVEMPGVEPGSAWPPRSSLYLHSGCIHSHVRRLPIHQARPTHRLIGVRRRPPSRRGRRLHPFCRCPTCPKGQEPRRTDGGLRRHRVRVIVRSCVS